MTANRDGIKKGSKVKVEPVRNQKDIKAISKLLHGKPRDLLLWTMGINNGLRASDLVGIKIVQVQDLKPGDVLNIVESKTGKDNVLVINKSVYKALQAFLKEVQPNPSDYLFRSRKGGHISSQSVGRLIKTWCKDITWPVITVHTPLERLGGTINELPMVLGLRFSANVTITLRLPSPWGI